MEISFKLFYSEQSNSFEILFIPQRVNMSPNHYVKTRNAFVKITHSVFFLPTHCGESQKPFNVSQPLFVFAIPVEKSYIHFLLRSFRCRKLSFSQPVPLWECSRGRESLFSFAMNFLVGNRTAYIKIPGFVLFLFKKL